MAKRRTVRGPLTRPEVVQGGLSVAEAVGMESFSLAKVADILGVQTMSLYNHITDKSDLLDAMADAILRSVVIPTPTSSWAADLAALGHAFREATIRYPHTAPLVLTRRLNTPAALPIIDAALGALRRSGMAEPDRVPTLRMVIAFLIGSLVRETALGPWSREDSEHAIPGGDHTTPGGDHTIPGGEKFADVEALGDELAVIDHAAEFTRGMRLLIAAIGTRPEAGQQP